MKLKRLLVLCLLLALLGLAGSASAAHSPVKRAPTLLWKSYPLKQRRVAAPSRPLRPPALATEASKGEAVSLELALVALLGGAMLAGAGLLVRNRVGGAATAAVAGRRRQGTSDPEPEANSKPDFLVALRPAAATAADTEPEQEEPEQPPARPTVRPVEGGAPEDSPGDVLPLPILRALSRPLLRPVEEPVETPEAPFPVEVPQLPTPLPVDFEPEREPEAPDAEHLWHKAIPENDTEVALESCEIRLWRGYFRYQLYAATDGGSIDHAVALSPYFRLRDEDAPGTKATVALLELLDQLKAEGWTLAREGRRWYSFILERPLEGLA